MVFDTFSTYYDLLYQFVDYEKECDLLDQIFSKHCQQKPRSILDIGCGTGSHALLLTKRGYEITGIDISETMISNARAKLEKEGLPAQFFVQDMRSITLKERFDCAICLFGGFGYLHTYDDLISLFSGVSKHLNKGGMFLFEFWNIGGLKPTPYKSWMKTQDDKTVLYRLSESRFDPQTNILNIDFTFLLLQNNHVKTFHEIHAIRCYTLPEINQYLTQNDFHHLTAYEWDKKELGQLKKDTFRILTISTR